MRFRNKLIKWTILFKNRQAIITQLLLFFDSLYTKNELAFVITNHLFTEFIINSIIENRDIKLRKGYDSYKSKLDRVYEEKLIPEYLYNNLVGINKLRNSYAHNLLPDYVVTSYTTCSTSNFKNIRKISKLSEFTMEEVSCEDPENSEIYNEFLRDTVSSTVILLTVHVSQELGIQLPFERLLD